MGASRYFPLTLSDARDYLAARLLLFLIVASVLPLPLHADVSGDMMRTFVQERVTCVFDIRYALRFSLEPHAVAIEASETLRSILSDVCRQRICPTR